MHCRGVCIFRKGSPICGWGGVGYPPVALGGVKGAGSEKLREVGSLLMGRGGGGQGGYSDLLARGEEIYLTSNTSSSTRGWNVPCRNAARKPSSSASVTA